MPARAPVGRGAGNHSNDTNTGPYCDHTLLAFGTSSLELRKFSLRLVRTYLLKLGPFIKNIVYDLAPHLDAVQTKYETVLGTLPEEKWSSSLLHLHKHPWKDYRDPCSEHCTGKYETPVWWNNSHVTAWWARGSRPLSPNGFREEFTPKEGFACSHNAPCSRSFCLRGFEIDAYISLCREVGFLAVQLSIVGPLSEKTSLIEKATGSSHFDTEPRQIATDHVRRADGISTSSTSYDNICTLLGLLRRILYVMLISPVLQARRCNGCAPCTLPRSIAGGKRHTAGVSNRHAELGYINCDADQIFLGIRKAARAFSIVAAAHGPEYFGSLTEDILRCNAIIRKILRQKCCLTVCLIPQATDSYIRGLAALFAGFCDAFHPAQSGPVFETDKAPKFASTVLRTLDPGLLFDAIMRAIHIGTDRPTRNATTPKFETVSSPAPTDDRCLKTSDYMATERMFVSQAVWQTPTFCLLRWCTIFVIIAGLDALEDPSRGSSTSRITSAPDAEACTWIRLLPEGELLFAILNALFGEFEPGLETIPRTLNSSLSRLQPPVSMKNWSRTPGVMSDDVLLETAKLLVGTITALDDNCWAYRWCKGLEPLKSDIGRMQPSEPSLELDVSPSRKGLREMPGFYCRQKSSSSSRRPFGSRQPSDTALRSKRFLSRSELDVKKETFDGTVVPLPTDIAYSFVKSLIAIPDLPRMNDLLQLVQQKSYVTSSTAPWLDSVLRVILSPICSLKNIEKPPSTATSLEDCLCVAFVEAGTLSSGTAATCSALASMTSFCQDNGTQEIPLLSQRILQLRHRCFHGSLGSLRLGSTYALITTALRVIGRVASVSPSEEQRQFEKQVAMACQSALAAKIDRKPMDLSFSSLVWSKWRDQNIEILFLMGNVINATWSSLAFETLGSHIRFLIDYILKLANSVFLTRASHDMQTTEIFPVALCAIALLTFILVCLSREPPGIRTGDPAVLARINDAYVTFLSFHVDLSVPTAQTSPMQGVASLGRWIASSAAYEGFLSAGSYAVSKMENNALTGTKLHLALILLQVDFFSVQKSGVIADPWISLYGGGGRKGAQTLALPPQRAALDAAPTTNPRRTRCWPSLVLPKFGRSISLRQDGNATHTGRAGSRRGSPTEVSLSPTRCGLRAMTGETEALRNLPQVSCKFKVLGFIHGLIREAAADSIRLNLLRLLQTCVLEAPTKLSDLDIASNDLIKDVFHLLSSEEKGAENAGDCTPAVIGHIATPRLSKQDFGTLQSFCEELVTLESTLDYRFRRLLQRLGGRAKTTALPSRMLPIVQWLIAAIIVIESAFIGTCTNEAPCAALDEFDLWPNTNRAAKADLVQWPFEALDLDQENSPVGADTSFSVVVSPPFSASPDTNKAKLRDHNYSGIPKFSFLLPFGDSMNPTRRTSSFDNTFRPSASNFDCLKRYDLLADLVDFMTETCYNSLPASVRDCPQQSILQLTHIFVNHVVTLQKVMGKAPSERPEQGKEIQLSSSSSALLVDSVLAAQLCGTLNLLYRLSASAGPKADSPVEACHLVERLVHILLDNAIESVIKPENRFLPVTIEALAVFVLGMVASSCLSLRCRIRLRQKFCFSVALQRLCLVDTALNDSSCGLIQNAHEKAHESSRLAESIANKLNQKNASRLLWADKFLAGDLVNERFGDVMDRLLGVPKKAQRCSSDERRLPLRVGFGLTPDASPRHMPNVHINDVPLALEELGGMILPNNAAGAKGADLLVTLMSFTDLNGALSDAVSTLVGDDAARLAELEQVVRDLEVQNLSLIRSAGPSVNLSCFNIGPASNRIVSLEEDLPRAKCNSVTVETVFKGSPDVITGSTKEIARRNINSRSSTVIIPCKTTIKTAGQFHTGTSHKWIPHSGAQRANVSSQPRLVFEEVSAARVVLRLAAMRRFLSHGLQMRRSRHLPFAGSLPVIADADTSSVETTAKLSENNVHRLARHIVEGLNVLLIGLQAVEACSSFSPSFSRGTSNVLRAVKYLSANLLFDKDVDSATRCRILRSLSLADQVHSANKLDSCVKRGREVKQICTPQTSRCAHAIYSFTTNWNCVFPIATLAIMATSCELADSAAMSCPDEIREAVREFRLVSQQVSPRYSDHTIRYLMGQRKAFLEALLAIASPTIIPEGPFGIASSTTVPSPFCRAEAYTITPRKNTFSDTLTQRTGITTAKNLQPARDLQAHSVDTPAAQAALIAKQFLLFQRKTNSWKLPKNDEALRTILIANSFQLCEEIVNSFLRNGLIDSGVPLQNLSVLNLYRGYRSFSRRRQSESNSRLNTTRSFDSHSNTSENMPTCLPVAKKVPLSQSSELKPVSDVPPITLAQVSDILSCESNDSEATGTEMTMDRASDTDGSTGSYRLSSYELLCRLEPKPLRWFVYSLALTLPRSAPHLSYGLGLLTVCPAYLGSEDKTEGSQFRPRLSSFSKTQSRRQFKEVVVSTGKTGRSAFGCYATTGIHDHSSFPYYFRKPKPLPGAASMKRRLTVRVSKTFLKKMSFYRLSSQLPDKLRRTKRRSKFKRRPKLYNLLKFPKRSKVPGKGGRRVFQKNNSPDSDRARGNERFNTIQSIYSSLNWRSCLISDCIIDLAGNLSSNETYLFAPPLPPTRFCYNSNFSDQCRFDSKMDHFRLIYVLREVLRSIDNLIADLQNDAALLTGPGPLQQATVTRSTEVHALRQSPLACRLIMLSLLIRDLLSRAIAWWRLPGKWALLDYPMSPSHLAPHLRASQPLVTTANTGVRRRPRSTYGASAASSVSGTLGFAVPQISRPSNSSFAKRRWSNSRGNLLPTTIGLSPSSSSSAGSCASVFSLGFSQSEIVSPSSEKTEVEYTQNCVKSRDNQVPNKNKNRTSGSRSRMNFIQLTSRRVGVAPLRSATRLSWGPVRTPGERRPPWLTEQNPLVGLVPEGFLAARTGFPNAFSKNPVSTNQLRTLLFLTRRGKLPFKSLPLMKKQLWSELLRNTFSLSPLLISQLCCRFPTRKAMKKTAERLAARNVASSLVIFILAPHMCSTTSFEIALSLPRINQIPGSQSSTLLSLKQAVPFRSGRASDTRRPAVSGRAVGRRSGSSATAFGFSMIQPRRPAPFSWLYVSEVPIAILLQILQKRLQHDILLRRLTLRTLEYQHCRTIELYLLQINQALRTDKGSLIAQVLAMAYDALPELRLMILFGLSLETAPIKKADGRRIPAQKPDLLPKASAQLLRHLTGDESAGNANFEFAFFDKLIRLSGYALNVAANAREAWLRGRLETYCRTYIDSQEKPPLYLPFDRNARIVGINLDKIRVMQSAAKVPYMVQFEIVRDPSNKVEPNEWSKDSSMTEAAGPRRHVSIIFKLFDDIRQDQLTMQFFTVFRQAFHRVDLPLFLCPYTVVSHRCLSTNEPSGFPNRPLCLRQVRARCMRSDGGGDESDETSGVGGMIEVVSGTQSRHEIGKKIGNLVEFFAHHFGSRSSHCYCAAQFEFIRSLAAYSIASFLLQIKDRHNGNLLITDKGHIVHIDFGFLFDISPGRDIRLEKAPFKLTLEMIDLLGGSPDTEEFQLFETLVIQGYLAIREEASLLLSILSLMIESGLPCFKKKSLAKFKTRLQLDSSPEDAAIFMRSQVIAAYNALSTRLYDVVQYVQQGIHH